jgi:hypothetical protein
MADASSTANKTPPEPPRTRDRLAMIVFLVSAGAMTLMGGVLMWLGSEDDRGQVFVTTLPIISAWVGTVLAFYFTRENFESANATVQRTIDRLSPQEKLAQTPVKDAWTPRADMKGVELKNDKAEKDVSIKDICTMLTDPNITRVPVFSPDGSIKYLPHESMIFKYISDNSIRNTPVNPATTTLADFLAHKSDDGQEMRGIVTRIAFAPIDATLADAQQRLAAVAGAQDVIVTRTGKPHEPVEGWLTNADISKSAQLV